MYRCSFCLVGVWGLIQFQSIKDDLVIFHQAPNPRKKIWKVKTNWLESYKTETIEVFVVSWCYVGTDLSIVLPRVWVSPSNRNHRIILFEAWLLTVTGGHIQSILNCWMIKAKSGKKPLKFFKKNNSFCNFRGCNFLKFQKTMLIFGGVISKWISWSLQNASQSS